MDIKYNTGYYDGGKIVANLGYLHGHHLLVISLFQEKRG